MLGFWWSLGDEIGSGLLGGTGTSFSGKEEEEELSFSVEEGGDSEAGCSGFSHSLWTTKGGRRRSGAEDFKQLGRSGARAGFKSPLAGAAATGSEGRPRRWAINAPEKPLRC